MKTVFVKVVIVLATIGIGYFFLHFLSSFREEQPRKKPAPVVKVVESEVIFPRDLVSEIEAMGKVRTAQPVILYSEVAGILIKGDINFTTGSVFRKGDLLISIDDRQMIAELNTLKSDLMNSVSLVLPEIKLDFPEEYNKWVNYFNSIKFGEPISELPEVSNNKIKVFLTRFNVYKLFYQIKNSELKHEKHYFYAPFNGSVVSADLREGASVRSGNKIGEIINLSSLEIEVPVPLNDLKWLNLNIPVKIFSNHSGKTYQGKISRKASFIDERTQSVTHFITLNGTSDFFDGLFVNVIFPGRKIENAVKIPSRAIYQSKFAYFIESGKLDYRSLDIVKKEKDSVIAVSGFEKGDTIVTALMQGVTEGMFAKPILK